MFRIFSRFKSKESSEKKLKKKRSKYVKENRGIQDIFGVRVVLYFIDDITVCKQLLCGKFDLINSEEDSLDTDVFKPYRRNYVFNIPQHITKISEEIKKRCMIDNTFEVQVRTIFSEGWHEVEHDIRYKYNAEWRNEKILSRGLNGTLAILESCDNNLLSICNSLAYSSYNNKKWESMIRNKYRLRFKEDRLSEPLRDLLSHKGLGKDVFDFDRTRMIQIFASTKIGVTYNNIVYIIILLNHDESIINMVNVPDLLRRRVRQYQDT